MIWLLSYVVTGCEHKIFWSNGAPLHLDRNLYVRRDRVRSPCNFVAGILYDFMQSSNSPMFG